MVIIYVIYADVFYLTNVFMNMCILSAAARLNRCAKRKRLLCCLAASLIGSAFETLFLLTLQNEVLYLLLSHFAVIPFMTFLAFERSSAFIFFQNTMICYGIALLLGGVTEALQNTFQIKNIQVFAGVAFVLISDKVIRRFYYDMKKKGTYLNVELKNNGRTKEALAFFDSGNLLNGPDGRTPVHFLDERLWEWLAPDESRFAGEVTYRTVGSAKNIARVYEIDALTAHSNMVHVTVKKAYVAKADSFVFCNKRYSVILNSQIEEELRKNEGKYH